MLNRHEIGRALGEYGAVERHCRCAGCREQAERERNWRRVGQLADAVGFESGGSEPYPHAPTKCLVLAAVDELAAGIRRLRERIVTDRMDSAVENLQIAATLDQIRAHVEQDEDVRFADALISAFEGKR